MSKVSEVSGPGFLCVAAQPDPDLSLQQFHDWYNTEHGPARLKLDFMTNGYRYKARDAGQPQWLACYDLSRLSGLAEAQYVNLRENRSKRERNLIKHVVFDRRLYSFYSSRGEDKSPAAVIMAVTFVFKKEHLDEIDRWYEEEHTQDLSKIPGWLRTRRFRLVEGAKQDKGTAIPVEQEGMVETLAIHEFAHDRGLDGPEHVLARTKPWREEVVKRIETRSNRVWDFHHAFQAEDYRYPDANGEVKDVSASTETGATLLQIDGCNEPGAPMIVFSNSLLTDLRIWDSTVAHLKASYPKVRILRYNTRGYDSPSARPVDVDLLTDDLAGLLDQLGVKRIHALIGVSLGGITCINFAIRYPQRLDRFIACDCNVSSSVKNTKAWEDRVSLARSDGGWEKLADQTMKRWFTSASVIARTHETLIVKDMILAASKEGYVSCVAALCDYDFSDQIKSVLVPGLCLAGSEDGVLPTAMPSFTKSMPQAEFVEVADAGHLPMVEKAHSFTEAILPFLKPEV